ncbi:MAG: hypothetical protein WCH35_07295 [Comamonadaceae bacterium]
MINKALSDECQASAVDCGIEHLVDAMADEWTVQAYLRLTPGYRF